MMKSHIAGILAMAALFSEGKINEGDYKIHERPQAKAHIQRPRKSRGRTTDKIKVIKKRRKKNRASSKARRRK